MQIQTASFATILGLLILTSSLLQAGAEASPPIIGPANPAPRSSDEVSSPVNRGAIRIIVEQETAKTSLPADLAEAVIFVESGFNAAVVGGVGEIGLMQIRPETAAMLGFKGSAVELAAPAVNIHYGVTYLSKAWQLAGGDLCRTLMKYRAGHGEEVMTPRSISYCGRARNYLVAIGSSFNAGGIATAPAVSVSAAAVPVKTAPTAVYARFKQGTAAASRAFWAVHESRIREAKAKIEAKWRRVAAR